jgi:PncC family amidohydrolase
MVGPGRSVSSGRWLAGRLLGLARARGLRLAVAESDTGGLVLSWLTAWPGSSAVVLGGVVAYADALKRDLLGVEASLIAEHGAVSQAVVEAMASGVCQATGADLGLASTGIAGPGGARPDKPVGLAWLAVAHAPAHVTGAPAASGQAVVSRQSIGGGGRADNRRASGRALLQLALEVLTAEAAHQPTPKTLYALEHMCYVDTNRMDTTHG